MSEHSTDLPDDLPPLPHGWSYTPLGALLEPDGLSYGVVQPGSDIADGVPVLRVKNLRAGRVVTDDVMRVHTDIEARYSRTRLRGGELLLSLVGTVGEVAIAPPHTVGWNVARAIGVLRPNDQVSSAWLKLTLATAATRARMRNWQNETVQATLNLRDVRRLPVPLPPLDLRYAIVELMAALDDKIAANNRVVAACDELRSLSLANVLAANPDRALMRPLSSLADFINGRAFTKDATGTGRMVVRIAEINSGPGGSTVYNDVDVPDVHLTRPGDVLFAWSGSLTVARWYRPEAIINQHIFKVLPRNGLPTWLVYEMAGCLLGKFRDIAADKATTMGHIQRRHLDELVLAPVDDAVPGLDLALGPLWERALCAEREVLDLEELRDSLLPKLMSGEIRVRNAQTAVEEAL